MIYLGSNKHSPKSKSRKGLRLAVLSKGDKQRMANAYNDLYTELQNKSLEELETAEKAGEIEIQGKLIKFNSHARKLALMMTIGEKKQQDEK